MTKGLELLSYEERPREEKAQGDINVYKYLTGWSKDRARLLSGGWWQDEKQWA